MSTFDLFINLIEALTFVGFIYFVFHKKNGIIPAIVFIILIFMNTTIHNYFLLPEFSLTISQNLILLLYTFFLNKHYLIKNIFITLVINVLLYISVTLGMLMTNILFTFPFYEGSSYIFLTVLIKLINIVLCEFIYFFIKKTQVLNLKNKKIIYILIGLFLIDIIYTCCIEIIYYYSIFDKYMTIILTLINLLTLFLCFIFIESQKEQKKLLELQKNELTNEDQQEIFIANQQNTNYLRQWKHDITYIFSYISVCIINGNTDKALDTIYFYNNIINNYNLLYNTTNHVLNTILLKNNEQLINHHIHLYINTDKKEIPIDEKDYQFILNTFFSLAIQNCYSEYQKEIWISSFQKPLYFSLTFEYTNHVDSFVSMIKDIESILHKYDGLMSEKQDNDRYKLVMIIPLHSLD